jgi:hypothetical protein
VLETGTRIIRLYGALVDQVVEERPKRAHFEIDSGRRDQALVPQALLLLATDLL